MLDKENGHEKTMCRTNQKSSRKTNPKRVPTPTGHEYRRETPAEVIDAEANVEEQVISNENEEEAQIDSLESPELHDNWAQLHFALFSLSLVVIAVVLGFVFISRSLEPDSSSENLKNLIVSVSLDGGASLEDDSSPQSRALSWLEGNALLNNYADWQNLQRYVLATLHFSTNGLEWNDYSGCLSDDNECDWYNSYSDHDPCDNDGQHVSFLGLYGNGLKGTIPPELASLKLIVLFGAWRQPNHGKPSDRNRNVDETE